MTRIQLNEFCGLPSGNPWYRISSEVVSNLECYAHEGKDFIITLYRRRIQLAFYYRCVIKMKPSSTVKAKHVRDLNSSIQPDPSDPEIVIDFTHKSKEIVQSKTQRAIQSIGMAKMKQNNPSRYDMLTSMEEDELED